MSDSRPGSSRWSLETLGPALATVPLVAVLLYGMASTVDREMLAREVNVAGRERMLIFRLLDEAHPLGKEATPDSRRREGAAQTMALLRANAASLRRGGVVQSDGARTFTVGPARNPEIAAALDALLASLERLYRALAEPHTAGPNQAQAIRGASDEAVAATDAVVAEMERHSAHVQARETALVLAVLGLALAIAAVLSWSARRTWRQLAGAERTAAARADALEQSEAINRTVLESAVDGVIVIDEAGLVQRINPAGEQMFGWKAGEILGRNVDLLMPEPYHSAHDGYLRHYLETGEKKIIGIGREVEGLRSDGTRFPIHLTVSETLVGGRRLFAGIIRDVSARKRVEQERDRFFAISRDLLCIAGTDGFFKRVNPAFEARLGWSAADLLGRPFIDFVHPEDVAATLAEVQKLASGAPGVRFENRYRTTDGSYRTLLWSTTPDPSTGLLYATARDVTEERKQEQELAGKNLELQAASRIDRISSRVMLAFSRQQDDTTSQQVLDVLTDEGQYRPLALYLYDEWQGQLRLAASASLPAGHGERPVRLGEGLVGSAAARREAVVIDAPEDGTFDLDTGVGLVKPGTIFAIPLAHGEKLLGVLAGASPLRLGARERGWIVQIAGQVAVGLHAQQQFQELKLLSEQLNERTRRIAQQNQDLERASRLKSQFLANMSHELRTPLNAIIGFSEVLKDGLLGTLEAPQLDYVSEIFESGRHLLSLINDILDLSKIEAGKMELELEPVELPSLLDNALSIVKERAAREGVGLAKAIASDTGALQADGRKLRQIVYNLLSNAVKFTPKGGSVSLEATCAGDAVEIAVRDTGIGISPADIPRLFKPFEQLEGGIDRRFEGTGLGLVMVKSLVELHGGTIGVESEPGRGSRFWVRLPRRAPGQPGEARAPLSASPPLAPPRGPDAGAPRVLVIDPDPEALGPGGHQGRDGTPRILVVDDEPNAREVLRLYLADAGFRVDIATEAKEALRMIEADPPDLVTLDLDMPGVDGVGFLGLLARSEKGRSVPVVIVSGAVDPGQAKALGASAVLEKPVQRHALVALARQLTQGEDRPGWPLVLVVDDDPRVVQIVTTFFAGEPFEVAAAFGGRDAIDVAQARRPDLVVVDLMMPEVSGFDVIAWLRGRPETVAVPIIVLTAKQLTAAEEEAVRKNVERVFAKATTSRDELLAEVRRILGHGPNTASTSTRSRS